MAARKKQQTEIPALREAHPAFARAADRLAELQAKETELRERVAELRERLAAAEEPAAAELVAADDLDAALAADTGDLRHRIDETARQLRTVEQAASVARRTVDAESKRAKRAVGEAVADRYAEVARRQALALVELGEAIEEYRRLEEALPGRVAECGLPQFPLTPLVDDPAAGLFRRLVGDAMKAGALSADELPRHWR